MEPDLKSHLKEVLTQDRKDRCFFIEVHEGMSNKGARALHKLRRDDAQLKKSFRHARIGLRIAGISLFFSFIGLVYIIIKEVVLRLL